MSEQFTLNRKLYTDSEKKMVLEEGDPRAAFVIGGKGSPVTDDDVKHYGLDDSHRLSEDEEASMEDAQAKTRKATGDATAPAAGADSAPDEPEGDGEGKGAGDEAGASDDLESLKVAELKELAEKEGVDLTGITLKADIIAAIEEKRKG